MNRVVAGLLLLVSSPVMAQLEAPFTAPDPTDDGLQVPATLAPIAPDQASADEPEAPPAPFAAQVTFGHRGEWVMLGSSNALRIDNETFENSSASFFDVGGEIGIDRFVVDNVSVGFDVGASYRDAKGYGATSLNDTKSSSFTAGVRFGVDLPLGKLFSWYPRLTLSLGSAHSDSTSFSTDGALLLPPSSQSSVGPAMNLYAPLFVHLAPHLLVGFGPRLQHNFAVERGGPYDGSRSTLIGGQFAVGGWWGGAPSDASSERDADFAGAENASKEPDHAFGEQGQIVLTFATDASASYQSYSGSPASATNTNFEPSFDYFFAKGVSLGVDAFFGYSKSTSIDGLRTTTQASSTNRGIAPRLGANFALTRFVSIWLTGEVGIGTLDQTASSAQGSNQHSRTRTWLDFSLPVLVHPSTHFFVGGGPFVFHELSDKDQFNFQNPGTEFGVSLLLGGWFAAPGAHPT